jgi:ABC-type uncharacterized transport system permease subunit
MLTTAAALLAIVNYALSSVLLLRTRGDASNPSRLHARLLATAAAVAHLAHHGLVFRAVGGPDVHFFAALSLVGLGMAALTVAVAWFRPIETLGVVVFPLAAALLGLDLALGHPAATAVVQSWQITVHVVVALLAYATLSIAALVAIMLTIQERALRTHRIAGLMGALPPLSLVEALLFQLIRAGFVLLSLTLLTGILFVENLFAQHLVHKTVLSIAAWLVFGTLLFGRWRWGWRGRRAVRWTLTGMALLLLAFLGSKFVLEIVLHRAV